MSPPLSPVVWVTGSRGQVGRALRRQCPAHWRVHWLDSDRHPLTRPDWIPALRREAPPDLVIHAAAWTAVDAAEGDPAGAYAVNVEGTRALLDALDPTRTRLLLLSTDYVFDGTHAGAYAPDHPLSPCNVYGQSKALAEAAVRAWSPGGQVLRTSWVHDDTGPNFVVTMLRLLATRDEVRVVDDQLGRPTHADSVARAILAWSDRAPTPPVLHWSDGGVATWYDLASATWWLARERGLPLRSGPPVPIPSTDYPTRAPRPRNTVLCLRSSASALGLVPCHWLTTLAHSLPPGPR